MALGDVEAGWLGLEFYLTVLEKAVQRFPARDRIARMDRVEIGRAAEIEDQP